MTMSMLEGYLEEMPAVRAERVLEMAEALHPTRASLDRLVAVARGESDEAPSSGSGRRSLFIVNGEPVDARGLRRWFIHTVGRRAVA